MPHVIVKLLPGRSEQQKSETCRGSVQGCRDGLGCERVPSRSRSRRFSPRTGRKGSTGRTSSATWTGSTRSPDTTRSERPHQPRWRSASTSSAKAGEDWRRLGIVQVVPRPSRAPILQHLDETSLREIGLRQVLRHVGQPEPGHRGVEDLEDAVEDELAFHAHPQLLAVLLELPGVQPAIGGQAQVDAGVSDQVLRRRGGACFAK